MANEKKTLKPFKGATHARFEMRGDQAVVVEYVKATQWKKDGDHAAVERYPIDKRQYKGLLIASKDEATGKREKWALMFGDWIVENEQGQLWGVSGQRVETVELEEVAPDTFKRKKVSLLSPFDQHYVPLDKAPTATAYGLAILVGLLSALLAGGNDMLPVFLAVTHLMYYTPLLAQWNGSANIFDLDEAADDARLSAHTNTYTVNQDTHDFFDDVTNEVTGGNYTAGGEALGSQLLSRTTNTVTFDANDVVWLQSGTGFTNARKFVLRRNTGVASTSRLFSVVTADNDVGNLSGDLTVAWHTSGIATWSTT